MPDFTFTSPEGKSYTVSGPAGATKEEAFGILQKQIGPSKPSYPGINALPPEAGAPANAMAKPEPETGIGEKVAGAGEAALSAASSVPAGLAGQVAGVAKGLTGGKLGTQAGVEQAQDTAGKVSNALTYQPRTAAGQQDVKQIGQAMDASRLAGLPVEGSVLNAIPKAPAAAGAATQAAGRGALNALPAVDAETAQLARQAHGMGFRLTPDQVYGNKYGKMAGELAGQVPLSGSNRAHNQAVFNQNLVQSIGGEGGKLTRAAFNKAMTQSGEKIGEIAEKTSIPLDKDFVGALRQNATETSKYQTADVSRIVDSYVSDLVAHADESGVLPGKALRTINTKIGSQIRSTANGDLKHALGDLQDTLHDAMTANLTPEDQAALQVARTQYRNGKVLEPLVAKSPTGDISPAALLGAVTSNKADKTSMARGRAGRLGTLADIGQKFLKEPPSSGTAERRLIQNVATGAAGGVGATGAGAIGGLPGVAAAAALPYGAANLYNRAGPALTNKLINRPPQ